MQHETELFDNDDLFGSKRETVTEGEEIKRKQIISWLQKASAETPEILDGLDDSIVAWFMQSAYLLPKVLKLQSNTKIRDLKVVIQTLKQNGCLTASTISYLKNFVDTAPPTSLIWKILEDVYSFAVRQLNSAVPLVRVIGPRRPLILQRNVINNFLKLLGVPLLPDVFSEPKEIVDDIFRNGEFLLILYGKMTNESIQPKSTAVSRSRAIQNTQVALKLLEEKSFIDSSFIESSPAIVSGDQLVLQQVLSMIIFNCTKSAKKTYFIPNREETSYSEHELEREYMENSSIKDGLTLPKLIAGIDSVFSRIPHILSSPANETERKWNVRKTVEYLQSKPQWPFPQKINILDLLNGEKEALTMLYHGVVALYPQRFGNELSLSYLKGIIGVE